MMLGPLPYLTTYTIHRSSMCMWHDDWQVSIRTFLHNIQLAAIYKVFQRESIYNERARVLGI